MNEYQETIKAVQLAIGIIRQDGIDAALRAGLYWPEIAAACEADRKLHTLDEHTAGRSQRLPALSHHKLMHWLSAPQSDIQERAHRSGLSGKRPVLALGAVGEIVPAFTVHSALASSLRGMFASYQAQTPEQATADALRRAGSTGAELLSTVEIIERGAKAGTQHLLVDAGQIERVFVGTVAKFRVLPGSKLARTQATTPGAPWPADPRGVRKVTIVINGDGLTVHEGRDVLLGVHGNVKVSIKVDH